MRVFSPRLLLNNRVASTVVPNMGITIKPKFGAPCRWQHSVPWQRHWSEASSNHFNLMKETGSLHHLMVYNGHGKPKENSRGSSKRDPKETQKRNMTITRVAFGNSGVGHLQYYLPTGFVACGPISVVRNMYILILHPQQCVGFIPFIFCKDGSESAAILSMFCTLRNRLG